MLGFDLCLGRLRVLGMLFIARLRLGLVFCTLGWLGGCVYCVMACLRGLQFSFNLLVMLLWVCVVV